ncbi:cysteine desulfurase [Lachnospiraceae bacterium G11]|nr:cysteine desulfurase [Lachnospiraceae bacterium G11]
MTRMDKLVYLDNAATTKMKKNVLDSMIPFMTDAFYNPSASYEKAKETKKKIETAREQIAKVINAKPEEIYFTSGGSESDNWALKGIAFSNYEKGKHIITSAIEHPAILSTTRWLKDQGFDITYLNVNKDGIINIEELEKSIRPDTTLISIMSANNEIGSIQPLKEIGAIARQHKIPFHTDAVQAFGHIKIDVSKMKIDLLSASGHKIYGPKGVGILYVKSGIKMESLVHGGEQENGRRAGTYNVPGIIGMGTAASMALERLNNSSEEEIRDYFIKRILEDIPLSKLNGGTKFRLPNNINARFDSVDAEALLVMLGQRGICASAGSACTAGNTEPSHVLSAIGLTSKEANNSIRLTISDETTKKDVDYAVKVIKECVGRLRGRT